MSARIDLPYAGATHVFELDEFSVGTVQTMCRSGLPAILQRLTANTWNATDIVEPIRHGIRSLRAADRHDFVSKHTSPGNLEISRQTAIMIVAAAIYGVDDDNKLMIERKAYTPID